MANKVIEIPGDTVRIVFKSQYYNDDNIYGFKCYIK